MVFQFRLPKHYLRYLTVDYFYLVIIIFYTFISVSLYKCYPKAHFNGIPKSIKTINSLEYKYVLIVTVSITSFMLLESLLDVIFAHLRFSRVKDYLRKTTSFPYMIVLLIFICNSIKLYLGVPNNDFFLIHLLWNSTLIYITSATFSYAYSYGGKFWNSWILVGVLFFTCLGSHLKAIVFYQSTNENYCFRKVLYQVGGVIHLITISIILLYFITWSIKLYSSKKTTNAFTSDNWKCAIFGMSFLSTAFVVILVQFRYNVFNFPLYAWIVVECAVLSYVVFLYLFESRILRQERRQYLDELEFKRMFVRYISHEVRTPLNTVTMGLQVLSECLRGEGNAENLDTVNDIRTSCDIAVTTLNELLTFDKLEGGSLVLERSRLGAYHLIASTVEPFQVQASHANVSLTVLACHTSDGVGGNPSSTSSSASLHSLQLYADGTKIAQVVRNLVSNALKFTPQGGAVTVTVGVVRGEGRGKGGTGRAAADSAAAMLKVEVTDTGAGISAENQKRLFKEVVQFSPGKLQGGGGSGLGLYISASIVELHDGSLSVRSDGEGCGCSFTMLLPLLDTEGVFDLPVTPVSSGPTAKPTAAKKSRPISGFDVIHPSVVTATRNSGRAVGVSLEENDSAIERQAQGKDSALTYGFWDLTVLVVDDSSISRKMQCRLLRNRGCRCLEAENGEQAVAWVRGSLTSDRDRDPDSGPGPDSPLGMKIDVVVVDSQMPVMTGPAATALMRRLGYGGVVIGVTGNVSPEDIALFMDSGADSVLAKPLDIDTFDSTVASLLVRRRSGVCF